MKTITRHMRAHAYAPKQKMPPPSSTPARLWTADWIASRPAMSTSRPLPLIIRVIAHEANCEP